MIRVFDICLCYQDRCWITTMIFSCSLSPFLEMIHNCGWERLLKITKNQPKQPLGVFSKHWNIFFQNLRSCFYKHNVKLYLILVFFLENWINLKSYPNLPKFLIDDVIPEVGYVFRPWDHFFWTQRWFLLKKKSNDIGLRL